MLVLPFPISFTLSASCSPRSPAARPRLRILSTLFRPCSPSRSTPSLSYRKLLAKPPTSYLATALSKNYHARAFEHVQRLVITAEGSVSALALSPTLPLSILLHFCLSVQRPFSLAICAVTNELCLKDKNHTKKQYWQVQGCYFCLGRRLPPVFGTSKQIESVTPDAVTRSDKESG